MDSGFSSGGAPFECTVAEKKTPALMMKKVALIVAYVLWAVIFFWWEVPPSCSCR